MRNCRRGCCHPLLTSYAKDAAEVCRRLDCPVLCELFNRSLTTATVLWRRGVAVERRIRDQEVAGSSLDRKLRRKNSGQVSHTYVPLLPSSITIGTGQRAVTL